MKKSISSLLVVLMLFILAACGGDSTDKLKSPKTINAKLWDLVYDEADGWTYKEENFTDDDNSSDIVLSIPKEEGDYDLITFEINADIEDPYDFRDYLNAFGFDEYEYEVNKSYELTKVGGINCLKQEGNYWGSPCVRYLNRVEGANATVLITIVGEYQDERVDKLLSGLTLKLNDIGNEDGPWYWEGEAIKTDDHKVTIGKYEINSQWLPFEDCIISRETFDNLIAVVDDQAYLLLGGALKRYDYDGKTLKFKDDIKLDSDYDYLNADTKGGIWLSSFTEPLINIKDGEIIASYQGADQVAMHPSGTWGINYFSSGECNKVMIAGDEIKTEPLVFEEVESVRYLMVDENNIFISGSAPNSDDHNVFVYDLKGNLKAKLADSEGESLGSITYITSTKNGYIGLDGNMRELVLWDKNGKYIGSANDSDLFGTYYPWFCGATKLEDGSLVVIMTETRADKSAEELIAFRITGF